MNLSDACKSLSNNIYFQFLFGTIGIYASAFAGSVIHEKLLIIFYIDLKYHITQIPRRLKNYSHMPLGW